MSFSNASVFRRAWVSRERSTTLYCTRDPMYRICPGKWPFALELVLLRQVYSSAHQQIHRDSYIFEKKFFLAATVCTTDYRFRILVVFCFFYIFWSRQPYKIASAVTV